MRRKRFSIENRIGNQAFFAVYSLCDDIFPGYGIDRKPHIISSIRYFLRKSVSVIAGVEEPAKSLIFLVTI